MIKVEKTISVNIVLEDKNDIYNFIKLIRAGKSRLTDKDDIEPTEYDKLADYIIKQATS